MTGTDSQTSQPPASTSPRDALSPLRPDGSDDGADDSGLHDLLDLDLRDAAESFESLFNAANEGIVIHDGGCIVAVNAAITRMLGHTTGDMLGGDIVDFVVPRSRPLVEEHLASDIASPLQVALVHRNGTLLNTELLATTFSYRGRAVTILAVRDITERVRAEDALRQSEERFRLAFESAAIGMAIVDLSGRFVRVNRALCSILGYSDAELAERDFQSITHPDDLESDLALVEQLLSGEIDHYHLEKRYFHRAGRIVWILLSGALVRDGDGNPLHFIAQLQDITERKHAEIELARSLAELDARTRALEAKTREQETFIYSVAHDLRTPLISLQGVSNLLAEEYGAHLDDMAALYVERITANARRMEYLLNDLLNFSRIGRGEVAIGAVDLSDVVREASERVRRRAGTRPFDLRVAEELPVVRGNRAWLAELFTHLFDNAVRFTPLDRVPTITVAARPSPAQSEILVSDNGLGVPDQFREQIFGLFKRLPDGKAMHPEGMGTGLALVARIVELHGGTIRIESAHGSGTTVYMTLPVEDRTMVAGDRLTTTRSAASEDDAQVVSA